MGLLSIAPLSSKTSSSSDACRHCVDCYSLWVHMCTGLLDRRPFYLLFSGSLALEVFDVDSPFRTKYSKVFFTLCSLSSCVSLYLLPCPEGRRLSDDGWTRHGSMSIAEYCLKSLYCCISLAEEYLVFPWVHDLSSPATSGVGCHWEGVLTRVRYWLVTPMSFVPLLH